VLVHGIGGSFSIRCQDVSVYISCHSYGCVSEDLANYLQFDATREHQAGGGMTQFMRMPMVKSSSLADDREVSIEVSGSTGVPKFVVKMKPVQSRVRPSRSAPLPAADGDPGSDSPSLEGGSPISDFSPSCIGGHERSAFALELSANRNDSRCLVEVLPLQT